MIAHWELSVHETWPSFFLLLCTSKVVSENLLVRYQTQISLIYVEFNDLGICCIGLHLHHMICEATGKGHEDDSQPHPQWGELEV